MRTVPALWCVALLTSVSAVEADPIRIPLPLDVPVSVDIRANPVVTFGQRTIDFSGNLDQQFVAFLISQGPVGLDYRSTVAIRARDGLQELSGVFPPSFNPRFANQLPTYTIGTTDLIAFDLYFTGCCTRYSVSLVDGYGIRRNSEFATAPEPASLVLAASGLALALGARRRRRARVRGSAVGSPQ
jgi:hypothetical protein